MVLYHHTTMAHLPYIVHSGELRPSNYPLAGFPADLLFATSDPNGDRTATVSSKAYRAEYRAAKNLLVRFVLHGEDFGDWLPLLLEAGWNPGQIAAMQSTAASLGEHDLSKWRARATENSSSLVRACHRDV